VKEVHLFFRIVLILFFTLSACVVEPLEQRENAVEANIVAAGTEGIDIFDVSDPNDPKHLSRFNLDYRARNVFVKDKYSYSSGAKNGLVI
jgi:hypothetical protein